MPPALYPRSVNNILDIDPVEVLGSNELSSSTTGAGGLYGPQNGYAEQCALSALEAPEIWFSAPGTRRTFVCTKCVQTQNAQIFRGNSTTHKVTSCFCWGFSAWGEDKLNNFASNFFPSFLLTAKLGEH